LEFVWWNVVEVKLNKSISERTREVLATSVAPRGILSRKQHESKSRVKSRGEQERVSVVSKSIYVLTQSEFGELDGAK
jgi:hypothetical protein